MAIATRVEWYLGTHGVCYELIPHAESPTPLAAARAAHLDPGCVAKSVLLSDEHGYLVAVLPASRDIDLSALSEQLHRIFVDCDCDALPAVGVAYGIPTGVDHELFDREDLYFEGGDHGSFVHLAREEFQRLMTRSLRASFCGGCQ